MIPKPMPPALPALEAPTCESAVVDATSADRECEGDSADEEAGRDVGGAGGGAEVVLGVAGTSVVLVSVVGDWVTAGWVIAGTLAGVDVVDEAGVG